MRRTGGFTLLEAVASLGLAAAVASLGALRVTELLASARLAAAARTLATSLRLARGRALAGPAPVEVRFDDARGTWALVGGGGEALAQHALPVGVGFAALPARRRVRFGGLGTADNATIRLTDRGTRARDVVVNQRGRVRLP
jgi:general secretion pathway protein H